MNFKNQQGSIMLETVLVLPIFILIIFFLIQMTFVWTAKQMTYYAAYCGARAALVYNPADYYAEKQADGSWKTDGAIRKGIVHQAACAVLSWVSWSIGGYDITQGRGLYYISDKSFNELMNFRIGLYSVPLSSNVKNQVTVEVKEFEKIPDEEDKNSKKSDSTSDGETKEEPASIEKQFPAVTVSVTFKCPLFIPLGGPIIAYFFGARDQLAKPIDTHDTSDQRQWDSIGAGGFTAPNGEMVHANLQLHGNYTKSKNEYMKTNQSGGSLPFLEYSDPDRQEVEYYSIPLTETCTMAKPYKTDTFPLMPKEDKKLMGMME